MTSADRVKVRAVVVDETLMASQSRYMRQLLIDCGGHVWASRRHVRGLVLVTDGRFHCRPELVVLVL